MSKIIDGIKKDLSALPNRVKGKVKSVGVSAIFKKSIPYVIIGYVFNKLSWLYGYTSGNVIQRLVETLNNFSLAFTDPLPSIAVKDILVGIGAGLIMWLVVIYRSKNAKKFRKGVEYGSARWGNEKDIAPFKDPVFKNNVILTASEWLMCSFPAGKIGNFIRPSHPKYGRNKNILVVGGSGSGKTRFFVIPNIMQMHSTFVVTDPKGLLCKVQNVKKQKINRPINPLQLMFSS